MVEFAASVLSADSLHDLYPFHACWFHMGVFSIWIDRYPSAALLLQA
jgi:hypothetical protein